ncbi:hypothetical protein [Leptospira interrogans]|nr:hypothetical protein [Leptospira interrogans]ULG86712.1 hypothetical protein FH594_21970 [Leptospira interrogans]ULG86735.1 hypothetical protein FH594_21435 [Leptospira interrogans]
MIAELEYGILPKGDIMKIKLTQSLMIGVLFLTGCTSAEIEKAQAERWMYSEFPTQVQLEEHKNFVLTEDVGKHDEILKRKIVEFFTQFEKIQPSEDEKCELPIQYQLDSKKKKHYQNYYLDNAPYTYVHCDVLIRSSVGSGFSDFHYMKTAILYKVSVSKNQIMLKIFGAFMRNQYDEGSSHRIERQIEFVQIENFAQKHFANLINYLKEK